jgi:hypothetical protein
MPPDFRTHIITRMKSNALIVRVRWALSIGVFVSAGMISAQNRNEDIESGLRTPRRCEPSKQTPCGADVELVHAALVSPAIAWEFITSPATGYANRRLAASEAGKTIPPDWILRVLEARRNLEAEEHLHHCGLQNNPLSAQGPWYQMTPRERIDGEIRRNILGHEFVVPETWIDFPLTDQALRLSPWPFQVKAALGDLYSAIVRDGDAATIDTVALGLPCADNIDAMILADLTSEVARHQNYAPPAVFGTWLNIIRNPKTQDATYLIINFLDSLARIDSSMAEVLGIESIKTGDSSAINRTRSFARQPHTLILAASRFVLSSDYQEVRRNRLQDLAYDANALRYAALKDSRSLPFLQNDAAKKKAIESFAEWFKQAEPSLQITADRDRALIESAYAQMSVATVCR